MTVHVDENADTNLEIMLPEFSIGQSSGSINKSQWSVSGVLLVTPNRMMVCVGHTG